VLPEHDLDNKPAVSMFEEQEGTRIMTSAQGSQDRSTPVSVTLKAPDAKSDLPQALNAEEALRLCAPAATPAKGSKAPWAEPAPGGLPPGKHHSYASIDRAFRANLAKVTSGLSPAVMAAQIFDWLVHLAISPGKQMELIEDWFQKATRLAAYAALRAADSNAPPCTAPSPQDHRFEGEAWQHWPYNLLYQSFLLNQQWWQEAVTHVDGVSRQHEQSLPFTVRQFLDIYSPSNSIWTNPEIAQATIHQGGGNLVLGFHNLIGDWQRTLTGRPPAGAEQFIPGQNVALTPGKVVFQNRLIELIQYSAATEQVHAEPVLIVPAWIMKFYILDLSPKNSLVRYLVEHGHTVFIISWKNPASEDRDLGMDDYRRLGFMAALDAITAIVPGRKVHAAGYCLGGTLLMISAAAMGRDGDDRLASLTLFAAQGDFTEAGEIMMFVNESQISYLESMMWDRGYLDSYQMAGAFQILRSNDLVWSRIIREYLLGERQPMNDMMAWNADATRMPFRMHSEYLRQLFLGNDLARGRFEVDGRPIWVTDIRVPVFTVGTTADHVAPWRSVYKAHLVPGNELTFVLASGGHNAGIVSEPGRRGRSYQVRTRQPAEHYVDPETWRAGTPVRQGSWWTEWQPWLARHSSAEKVAPPPMGAPEKGYAARWDAPGFYVLQH
jgi:polyhydroxyalkanoate synthase